MKLSKDVFSNSLPLVLVEKVTILPADTTAESQGAQFSTETQRVDFKLSVQKQEGDTMLPHRIFVGFTNNHGLLERMMSRESYAKSLIRNPSSNSAVWKRYLNVETDESQAVERGSTSSSSTIVKTSMTFTEEFNLQRLNDLYVYAVAYAIDEQSNTESGISRSISAMRIGLPSVETILVATRAPNDSVIYTIDEDVAGFGKKGDIWTGPVYMNGSDLMAGVPADADKHQPKLTSTRVPNQKVHDLRFLNVANKLPFSNSLLGQEQDRQTATQIDTVRKIVKIPAIISDAQYSRTTSGALKILFSVDRSKLADQNTKFGKLIEDKVSRMSTLRIENIRVYRARSLASTNSNALTPGKLNICGGNGAAISVDKLIGTLTDGSVQSVQLQPANPDVLNFVVNDSSIADEDIGTYQYTIFIDMVDLSASALGSISGGLTTLLAKYESYIDGIEISSGRASGKDFDALIKAQKREILDASDDWQVLIDNYLASVKFVFGTAPFSLYTSTTWRKNLSAMASPADGDMGSIRRVATVIRSFNDNLLKAFRAATKQGSSSAFNVSSKIGSQNTSNRKVEMEHEFRTKYIKRNVNSEGVDYLDDTVTANNTNNLTNIPFKNFNSRILEEVAKYDVPRPNAAGANPYGFLSPRRLFVPGNVIETNTKDIPQDEGNGLLASNLNPGKSGGNPAPPNNTNSIFEAEIDALLGYSDISMVPLRRPIEDILKDSQLDGNLDRVSTNYLNVHNEFNKDVLDASTSVSGSTDVAWLTRTDKSRKTIMLKSDLATEIVNSRSADFKKNVVLTEADTITESLAARDIDNNEISDKNNFANAINYNSITELQYFNGHTIVNGLANLDATKWETLTEDQFGKFEQSGQPILCRIITANKSITSPNNYKLPESGYDSLFFLGDSPSGNAALNLPAPQEMISNTVSFIKRDTTSDLRNRESGVDIAYTSVPLIHNTSREN